MPDSSGSTESNGQIRVGPYFEANEAAMFGRYYDRFAEDWRACRGLPLDQQLLYLEAPFQAAMQWLANRAERDSKFQKEYEEIVNRTEVKWGPSSQIEVLGRLKGVLERRDAYDYQQAHVDEEEIAWSILQHDKPPADEIVKPNGKPPSPQPVEPPPPS